MAQIRASQHYQVYDSASRRIKTYQARKQQGNDLDDDREKRIADPCLEVALLNVRHRPANVVMVGHSFLRRARDFMHQRYGFYSNLNIDHNLCQVMWEVQGGMRAENLFNIYLNAVMNHLPDIVYIEIGSNDLADPDLVPADPATDTYTLTSVSCGKRSPRASNSVLNVSASDIILATSFTSCPTHIFHCLE